jgi:(2Fe-2S) ferredoxin
LSLPPPHAMANAASGATERSGNAARRRADRESGFRWFIGGAQRIVPPRLERKTLSLTSPQARASFLVDPIMPFRSRYLFVCTNRRPDGHPKGSCAEKGSEEIVVRLKEALAKRGIAKDIVRACSSSCLDLCEVGITILQEPEHVAYGRVTLADVDAIADAAGSGQVVARLVVHPAAAAASGETIGEASAAVEGLTRS